MTEIKQVQTVEPTKKTPIFWRFLTWISAPALAFGVFTVYLGWDTMMNNWEKWGNTLETTQIAVSYGAGHICMGIAAIILGGIGVIVDVLSKTGNK